VLARNGGRPATDCTVNRARKFSGIRNAETSKPSPNKSQAALGLAGRGHPDTRPGGKSSAIHVSSPLRPRPVVAVLNARWRVVTCENSFQWILQSGRGSQWSSLYFCRTREGLIACVREYAGHIDGVAMAVLLRLPERIGGES
jgi:hypothetical protein